MKITFDDSGLKKAFKDFVDQVEIDSDEKLRFIALDLYGQVKKKTPVWTGSLRASWQIARNQPNLKIVKLPELKGGGPRNPNIGLSVKSLPRLKPSKKLRPIWISNNLPYARVVEHGLYAQLGSVGQPHKYKVRGKYVSMIRTTPQGFSTQAPQGMLKVSVLNITLKYKS